MNLSRRSRREWRIIFWIILTSVPISAYFGYAVAPADVPPLEAAVNGALTSLLIATPIALFEFKGTRVAFLRRLPLYVYFALRILFYFVVIVGSLLLMRVLIVYRVSPFTMDAVFRNSIIFSIAMAVFGNLVILMGGLLGFGTLKNLLTGRYAQPKREERAFLLIDMKDSTGLAERLGPIRFHEVLNEFFRDISDAALECGAEIHKYVGDEAILTWPSGRALTESDCLACAFVARDFITAKAKRYGERFGVVPGFRAALHYGEIVAGEIGDVRREIAYVGDTLNVAARLLDAAKTLGRDVLVSADLLERATLPPDLRAEPLPMLAVRGRAAPLGVAALDRI
ncbi:MAG TPA: adenylate/guanylate cyclase domain-containing protein, partial [Reyranella sp.]